MTSRLLRHLLATLIASSVVAAACATDSDPEAAERGPTVAGATTGDCFDAYPAGDEEIGLVDCTSPHEFEVFATVAIDVPGDRYPDVAEMTPIALELCPPLDEAVANSADLVATVLLPSEARWDDGEQAALCVLHHASLLKINRRQTPTE